MRTSATFPRFHLALLFVLGACAGGGGGGSPVQPPGPSPSTAGTVSGLITDQGGRPLSNAAVKVGTGTGAKTGTTNEQGFFAVSGVTPGQQVINSTLTGHVENSKLVEVRASSNSQVAIVLQDSGTTETINPVQPNTVIHRGGKVELPANSIVDLQGRTVTSAVVQITTLMPEDPNFHGAMPGEFRGVDGGEQVHLVSYGVLDIVLRDASGNPLQLAAGQTAQIEFPIGATDPVDASIPLWWADPTTGVWVREGTAQRSGNTYRGSVSHFTPWNLDKGRPTGTKRIRLHARGAPVIGATVRVVGVGDNSGWSAGGSTDVNGEVLVPVTANAPGFHAAADITMLASNGSWIVLRRNEEMPLVGETLLNEYSEADGVVQVACTVILRWGERPADLDTHVTIPTPGTRAHVFYLNKGRTAESPWCALDTDDTTSFGPEIITISQALEGTYRYSVHNFSGNGVHPISDSGASVTLVLPSQPTRVYNVPTQNPESRDVWAVFDLRFDAAGNATVTDLNQFGSQDVYNP